MITWVFALIYVGLSLAIEILLIAGGLRIPADNRIIAPLVLTAAPALAAWLAGYRRPAAFALVVVLTAVLTVIVVMAFVRLTGITTGFVQPIAVRSVAGWVAAAIVNRLAAPRR